MIVTDADGVILARTDKPGVQRTERTECSIVARALEGDEVSGLMLETRFCTMP